MSVFTIPIAVRGYEVDATQCATLRTLCNYMEEAAGLHAEKLGCGLETLREQGTTWVLARMRLVPEAMPPVGAEVAVHTWPVGVERLSFRRDFHLQWGQATALRAVTHWVIMNTSTRRLEKMPEWAHSLVAEKARPTLEESDIRIPSLAGGVPGPEFMVRLADIDSNGHVNNVRYIDFALEAAHAFMAQAAQGRKQTGGGAMVHCPPYTLDSLDIVFRAEALWEDTITSATAPAPEAQDSNTPLVLLHVLYRKNSGQELVRVRTVWKPLP